MLRILYGSEGLFATKMDIRIPFEIRIVAQFSTFYGKYGLDIFVVTDFLIFLQKNPQHNFIKTRGGGGQRPFINL